MMFNMIFKNYWNILVFGMIAFGTSLILILTATIFTPPIVATEVEPDTSIFTTEQVPISSVAELRDVMPTDWGFQALDDLAKNYNLPLAYPDGTFRGQRAVRRGELAQWFNSMLIHLEEMISIRPRTVTATAADLAELQQSLSVLQQSIGELKERSRSDDAPI